jgi:hypothetical protein
MTRDMQHTLCMLNIRRRSCQQVLRGVCLMTCEARWTDCPGAQSTRKRARSLRAKPIGARVWCTCRDWLYLRHVVLEIASVLVVVDRRFEVDGDLGKPRLEDL